AQWLERVINLQHSVGGSPDFHTQIARALVELVGLDLGMVLLHRDGIWSIAAVHAPDEHSTLTFSRTLLGRVLAERRTFYQNADSPADPTVSMQGVEAVVASPVFGLQD